MCIKLQKSTQKVFIHVDSKIEVIACPYHNQHLSGNAYFTHIFAETEFIKIYMYICIYGFFFFFQVNTVEVIPKV